MQRDSQRESAAGRGPLTRGLTSGPLPKARTGRMLLVFFSASCAAVLAAAAPQGLCDIFATGGTACVAAHSLVRALYAAYDGPLYQVVRTADGEF